METDHSSEWRVIIDLLKYTNPAVYNRIGRKMMNYLYKRNIIQIEELMKKMEASLDNFQIEKDSSENRPLPRINQNSLEQIIEEIFEIAGNILSSNSIIKMIKLWLRQEQSKFLVMAAEKRDISLFEITEALRKFTNMPENQKSLSNEENISIKVALIRRLFSDDLNFINVTKKYASIDEFSDILSHTIGPTHGNGKLGGKAAGLFRASKILMAAKNSTISLRNLTIPKTWYITSDGIIDFLHYNALEEMPTIKYRDSIEISKEYPYLKQIIKNSSLPFELIVGLNSAIDDFGDRPLIVRSSSLLEDLAGSSFAGKYKSLFVANKGSKREKLEELIDAILEVYASVFGPDPIEYRHERGLLDFNEEMAIMIQEVVGKKVGKYFFPAYAGVAFSNNELRWSPRIKREDGIIRLVVGLGTRAVDRVGDDYPMLISPGQPKLRVNISPEEIIQYSQKYIDIINMETKRFETKRFETLVQECGQEIPALTHIASTYRDGYIYSSTGNLFNLTDGEPLITFSKLIDYGPFVQQIKDILSILSNSIGSPVDIEFACDGDIHKIYLLQCRVQSVAKNNVDVSIPEDIKTENIIFTANKYVCSGKLTDIDYIVSVDPEKYNLVESYEDLTRVGRIISELNRRLPKQKYILMGPGRWGSRGDIKLGVRVIYSDINNTAMLIEIAKRDKDYVPELSFGTHFFQDLVEAQIYYLPLYPDDKDTIFNYEFINNAQNSLKRIIPDSSNFEEIIKVIQLSKIDPDLSFSVIMDGSNEKAVGFLNFKKK